MNKSSQSNFNKFVYLLLLIIAVISAIYIYSKKNKSKISDQSHNTSSTVKSAVSPTNLVNQRSTIYQTKEEIEGFFKSLGLEYSRQLKYDSETEVFKHMKKTDYDLYNENPSFYDKLTEQFDEAITNQEVAPLYIKWVSNEIGYGVFAATDIPKDYLIAEYVGEIVPRDKIASKVWSWKYPSKGSFSSKYPENISVNSATYGNETRFINHGDDPNLNLPNVSPQVLYANNTWRLAYISNRIIKKDEEVLVSYGARYWRKRKKLS